MNIVPCVSWVKRGVSKAKPDRIQLDKDDLKRLIEEAKENLDEHLEEEDDEQEGDGATASKTKPIGKRNHDEEMEEDVVAKYNLDDYDEEDESEALAGIGNLAYFASPDDDPYFTTKGEYDSDDEDFEIKATDNLIVAGKAEKDVCSLEIYVYNEDNANLYIHHDIMISSFPLAVEWMNFDVGEDKPGSFVAVGSMEPIIEIWDLDVVDSLEPVTVLGQKPKKKKSKKSGGHGHTDAVLDLSWNSAVRNVLASASADFTVGLWDLTEGKIVTSITQHKEKVQCVKWHPFEQQTLLSGSFDNTAKVYDCRNPNSTYKNWDLDGEIERVLWDTHKPFNFFASTDKGVIYYLDSRMDKQLFTLSAHDEAVTGISQSYKVPGLLVTTSSDKMFKVWDVQDNKPSLVLERNLKMGQLYCSECCPEAPFVFAIGGDGGEMKVWDIRESAAVRKHFLDRAPVGVTMEGDGDIKEEERFVDEDAQDVDMVMGDRKSVV